MSAIVNLMSGVLDTLRSYDSYLFYPNSIMNIPTPEETNDPRPPVGLRPEFIHAETQNYERVMEILAALGRYAHNQQVVPDEWLDELRRRLDPQKGCKALDKKIEELEASQGYPTQAELIETLQQFKRTYGTTAARTVMEFIAGKGAKVPDVPPKKREQLMEFCDFIMALPEPNRD